MLVNAFDADAPRVRPAPAIMNPAADFKATGDDCGRYVRFVESTLVNVGALAPRRWQGQGQRKLGPGPVSGGSRGPVFRGPES
jgi:hypothetical protein